MSQDGVIKFSCNWIKTEPFEFEMFESINHWRNQLYLLGLIGINSEGIGYGNISVRFHKDQFIITGSATGGIKNLSKDHYTKVISYNIEANSLTAQGPIIASSESLTHAAIYQSDNSINAIFHVHDMKLWQHNLDKLPTSDVLVEYGTPAMAHEIVRLYKTTDMPDKKIMIMGGHQEGVITFGNTVSEAGETLLYYYNLLK